MAPDKIYYSKQMRLGEPSRPFTVPSDTVLELSSQRHEAAFQDKFPISPGNHGIEALEALVNAMKGKTQNRNDPIVLASGFSGWGRPLFGTVNYWGGFENLPEVLAQAGYKVIVVKVGPLSSNRERACEVWTQLKAINNGPNGGYDLPMSVPGRIDIQYGRQHPAAVLGLLSRAQTWRPVVFGYDLTDWTWTWGSERPVHFICHSQGGTTIRYLIELLTGTHTDLFPGPDFPINNCQDWVASVVTIGTPHKGTTVTDVVQSLIPPDFLEILTRLVWSTSFDPPVSRFYDLQLDHWGFFREPNESLGAMHTRLAHLVQRWWNSNAHGLYDNSIPGVTDLDTFAPIPSQHTYYFTMSFCATVPFPNRTLSQQDVNEFLGLFPFNEVINPFGFLGVVLSTVLEVFSRLPFLPQLRDFTQWFIGVANRHLGAMNYFSQIPHAGSQIPRADILPALALPAYAMGGYQMTWQSLEALGHTTSERYQRNDGIVNTESMSGPVNAEYGEGAFPGAGIDTTDMASAKGKYWHLGENATMDHADQIGVFTSEVTANEVKLMYLLFADLVTRLRRQ